MGTALDNFQRSCLRVLIYPIQFESNPLDAIDRVISQHAPEDRAMFVASIDAGLQSEEILSDLLPQPHPEAVIRNYLAELQKRLETQSP